MTKSFHSKPFDDGTKIKLALYEGYLKEWLPVFVSRRKVIWNTVNIFDFFAGEGEDSLGTKGSPLITIDQVLGYEKFISERKVKVNLFFNEFDEKKYNILLTKLAPYKNEKLFDLHLTSLDFNDAFKKYYPSIKNSGGANLIFLDQFGVKQVAEEVFKKLIDINTTDFLFFISSSYFKRFVEIEGFRRLLNISKEDIVNEKYYNIHRTIFNHYRKLLPPTKKYYMAPFSIKKGSGIYGLIFGTNHTLGIEKFLKQSWAIDKQRGEANFDIDNEGIIGTQLNAFSGEPDRPKKLEVFEKDLKTKILNKELLTDYSVYEFALLNGIRPIDAKRILKQLIDSKKIGDEIKLITSDIHKMNPTKITLKNG